LKIEIEQVLRGRSAEETEDLQICQSAGKAYQQVLSYFWQ